MKRMGDDRIKNLLEDYLKHNRLGFEENIKEDYPLIYLSRRPVTLLIEGLVKWMEK